MTGRKYPDPGQGGTKVADRIYSISEAAAMVTVETHVLRYWEEELDLHIRRNDMGHRCYEEKDVKILQRVKTLKDKGIQLKAIKDIVYKMYEAIDGSRQEENPSVGNTGKRDDDAQMTDIISTIDTIRVRSDEEQQGAETWAADTGNAGIVDFKLAQFQNLMDKVVSSSIKDNIKVITQSVSAAVSDDVVKQMDVIMREREEQDEARYRRLDQTIRELQQSRQEAAAAEAGAGRRGLFRRRGR